MQVLVSDTSVLIDIERASLTARLFELPYEFVVPDLLYEAELLDWMGPELIELGLRVEELEPHEIVRATELKRQRAMLSTPDVFGFCLAAERGWTLLTGDGALRAEAVRQALPMHGVLWLFDEFQNHNVCTNATLRTGLETIRDHPRCRLPTREINQRLASY
ncbi:MAG: hypothetical protein ACRBBO_13580 [Cognatishimia sp.]